MKIALFLLAILTAATSALAAEVPKMARVPMWYGVKDGKYVVVLGSNHMVSAKALPDNALRLVAAADALVVESDLPPAEAMRIYQSTLARNSLRQRMTPAEQQELVNLMGLRSEMLDQMDPNTAAMFIGNRDYLSKQAWAGSMDEEIKASVKNELRKPVVSLDDASQVFSAGGAIPTDDLKKMIEMKKLGSMVYDGYLTLTYGMATYNYLNWTEAASLNNHAQMRNGSPEVYRNLITVRNRAWMDKIVSTVEQKGSAAVLVGELHLLGDDGIVTLLRSRGYQMQFIGDRLNQQRASSQPGEEPAASRDAG